MLYSLQGKLVPFFIPDQGNARLDGPIRLHGFKMRVQLVKQLRG
jgi:hypothetical protein